MLNHIELFFLKITRKIISGKSTKKKETGETKKCKNCLRRIEIDNYRCPFCRASEFVY
jgi:hypothetical protein